MYYKIALCHKNLDETAQAMEYLEKCLELAPDFEEGRRLLGEPRVPERT